MQGQKGKFFSGATRSIGRELSKNKYIYIMLLPVFIYYIMFHYVPMAGVLIAFQDYSPRRGITGSEWVGFTNFIEFFTGPYFVFTVQPSTRGRISRCTPSRDTAGPLEPLPFMAILSISSINIMPSCSARSRASDITASYHIKK